MLPLDKNLDRKVIEQNMAEVSALMTARLLGIPTTGSADARTSGPSTSASPKSPGTPDKSTASGDGAWQRGKTLQYSDAAKLGSDPQMQKKQTRLSRAAAGDIVMGLEYALEQEGVRYFTDKDLREAFLSGKRKADDKAGKDDDERDEEGDYERDGDGDEDDKPKGKKKGR